MCFCFKVVYYKKNVSIFWNYILILECCIEIFLVCVKIWKNKDILWIGMCVCKKMILMIWLILNDIVLELLNKYYILILIVNLF